MDKKIHNSQDPVLCKKQKDHKILLTKAANLVQRNAIQGTMQKYSKMIQEKCQI